MDHPSKDWKDPKTGELLVSKHRAKILNHFFRFNSLVDEADHFKCLFWEKLRTEVFLKIKKNPFRKSDHLDRPYLSYTYRERKKWSFYGDQKELDNLLTPHLGSNEEIEIGGSDDGLNFVCHTPTLKVPVELFIHPNWTENHLNYLFKKQVRQVLQKSKAEQKKLQKQGYVFLELPQNNPVKRLRKRLKALGHFRLLYCVKLSEDVVRKHYGGDAYSDEKTMKRAIKECLPKLHVKFT